MGTFLIGFHRVCTAVDTTFSWKMGVYQRVDLIYLSISRGENGMLQKIAVWKVNTVLDIGVDGLDEVR